MIRTKYLFFTIFGCVAVLFSTGVFSLADNTSSRPINERNEVIFGTPKEKYTIAGTSRDTRQEEREAFKNRVRERLSAEPIIPIEEEIVQEDLAVTTPTDVLALPAESTFPETVSVISIPLEVATATPTNTILVATTTPATETSVSTSTTEELPI